MGCRPCGLRRWPEFQIARAAHRGRIWQCIGGAETASANGADGTSQRFVADLDIPGEWWTLFLSPKLNTLVEQALKANPNGAAAAAALRQAHELYLAQRASFLPVVQGSFSATRARNPLDTLANPTSLPQTIPTTVFIRPSSASAICPMCSVHAPFGRSGQGTSGGGPVPTRSNLPDLEQQCRSHRSAGSFAAGSGCSDRASIAVAAQLTETVKRQRALGTASDLDLLPKKRPRRKRSQRCRRCRSSWVRRAMP